MINSSEIGMVYVVHMYGGEYSDSWDNVIGVFDNIDKARELVRLKQNNEERIDKIANNISNLPEDEFEKLSEETRACYYHEPNFFYIGELKLNQEDVEKRIE